jgi:DNA-binding GntR family transcriptional regulator
VSGTKAADLSKDIAQGIASGRFPVGSLLPTEFELCDQYGASRYTVRLALGELQEQGLISRKKNVGSRVEASRPTTGFVQSLSSVEDLVLFGATNFRVVRSIEEVVADLALAKELGCAGGSRWLRVSSLRFDSNNRKRPVAWLDVYIDPAYADVAEAARQSPNVLISSLIESRYGRRIARIQQVIDATAVPKTMAEALKAEPGSPALKVLRRYMDAANEAFELSVSIHPAGRLTVSTDLKRSRE